MNKRGGLILVLAIAGILCLGLIAGGVISLSLIPPMSQQIPVGYSQLHAYISNPLDQSRLPCNTLIHVAVESVGSHPLQSIEFLSMAHWCIV